MLVNVEIRSTCLVSQNDIAQQRLTCCYKLPRMVVPFVLLDNLSQHVVSSSLLISSMLVNVLLSFINDRAFAKCIVPMEQNYDNYQSKSLPLLLTSPSQLCLLVLGQLKKPRSIQRGSQSVGLSEHVELTRSAF